MKSINIFTAQEVAQSFQSAGIAVESWTEADDQVDGEVTIDKQNYIQVCAAESGGGLLACKMHSINKITHGPTRQTIAEVINDFKYPQP